MSKGLRSWLAAWVMALLPGAVAAREAPVAISGVKVETRTSTIGRTKGNDYLRVSFTANVNDSVGPRMNIRIKAKARLGDRTQRDDFGALGKLDGLAPGSYKDYTAPLFMGEGLGGRPDSCELAFMLVRFPEKTGTYLGEFCWTGGRVKTGPCEE